MVNTFIAGATTVLVADLVAYFARGFIEGLRYPWKCSTHKRPRVAKFRLNGYRTVACSIPSCSGIAMENLRRRAGFE